MTYEQFKIEITNFFRSINELIVSNYSDILSSEKLARINNFSEEDIVFYSNNINVEKNKLYINIKYFINNGIYDVTKLENSKRQFLEKYFEKFVIGDYEKDAEQLMMKYIVEDECNKFIQRNNLDIKLTDNYQHEYILTLIKNKMGINYKKYIYQKDIEQLLNSLNDENLKTEYLKLQHKNQNQKFDKKDEQEQIAEIYGVDLTDIEVIIIKSKKYYKFKKDNAYIMIETNTNLSMVQDFKNQQEESTDYKTADSKQNKDKIVQNMIDNKINLSLIPINDLAKYNDILSTLPREQLNYIRTLFINRQDFNIEVINIYDGIAIDKSGRCLFVEKNSDTEMYEIKYAETDVYSELETKKLNDNITSDGTNMNIDEDSDVEIIDTIDNKDKVEQKSGHQKRFILKRNHNYPNGFINVLVLSLITGFISGCSLGILLILMK